MTCSGLYQIAVAEAVYSNPCRRIGRRTAWTNKRHIPFGGDLFVSTFFPLRLYPLQLLEIHPMLRRGLAEVSSWQV